MRISSMARVTAAKTSTRFSFVSEETGVTSESVSSGNDAMTAAVLSPGDAFAADMKNSKMVNIDHLHVSLALAYLSVLKATVQRNDIHLVSELTPCAECLTKDIRAPPPYHTTAQAATAVDVINIDTTGPYPESLENSRFGVMFVDSLHASSARVGPRTKTYSPFLV